MSAKDSKLFQVRLTEAEKRSIKAMAAGQGLTLRQAIVEAFTAWSAQIHGRPSGPLGGIPTGGDVQNRGSSSRAAAPRIRRMESSRP
jgi:hypothetical protein